MQDRSLRLEKRQQDSNSWVIEEHSFHCKILFDDAGIVVKKRKIIITGQRGSLSLRHRLRSLGLEGLESFLTRTEISGQRLTHISTVARPSHSHGAGRNVG